MENYVEFAKSFKKIYPDSSPDDLAHAWEREEARKERERERRERTRAVVHSASIPDKRVKGQLLVSIETRPDLVESILAAETPDWEAVLEQLTVTPVSSSGQDVLVAAVENLKITMVETVQSLAAAVEAQNRHFVEAQSVTFDMSKAVEEKSKDLLAYLGISWSAMEEIVGEAHKGSFDWTGGEEVCTPKAIQHLEGVFEAVHVQESRTLDDTVRIVDVRKVPLELRGNRIHTKGHGDVAVLVRQAETDIDANIMINAVGMIELKTREARINNYQAILQLVCLSRVSEYGQGVAVMATDLVEKWRVYHFIACNDICVKKFFCERDAYEFFKNLLESCPVRGVKWKEQLGKVQLSPVLEGRVPSSQYDDDQNLDGENLDPSEIAAVRTEKFLSSFAIALNERYGVDLRVPLWARNSNVAPVPSGMYI